MSDILSITDWMKWLLTLCTEEQVSSLTGQPVPNRSRIWICKQTKAYPGLCMEWWTCTCFTVFKKSEICFWHHPEEPKLQQFLSLLSAPPPTKFTVLGSAAMRPQKRIYKLYKKNWRSGLSTKQLLLGTQWFFFPFSIFGGRPLG